MFPQHKKKTHTYSHTIFRVQTKSGMKIKKRSNRVTRRDCTCYEKWKLWKYGLRVKLDVPCFNFSQFFVMRSKNLCNNFPNNHPFWVCSSYWNNLCQRKNWFEKSICALLIKNNKNQKLIIFKIHQEYCLKSLQTNKT